MKKVSRADLASLRERQIVTFEERLRREKLRARQEEAEVLEERGERAEAAAEIEAEELRRQKAVAYESRLSAEREQMLMDMRSRRLEAEEVEGTADTTSPHRTAPHLTSPHLSLLSGSVLFPKRRLIDWATSRCGSATWTSVGIH